MAPYSLHELRFLELNRRVSSDQAQRKGLVPDFGEYECEEESKEEMSSSASQDEVSQQASPPGTESRTKSSKSCGAASSFT